MTHERLSRNGRIRRLGARAVETAIVLFAGIFLFLALRGQHPETNALRDYILNNGSHDTGALNLVTAIYLGYRLFDTVGETIVLLLSVAGVLLFTEGTTNNLLHRPHHEKDEHT